MSDKAESTDLTIVIEMDTKEITGGIYDYAASLREWVRQAEALSDRECEILVSSPTPDPRVAALSTDHIPVENLVTPGASYYGLKNAGANAARGRIVLFSDSDCRPCAGYLESLLRAFEDPEVCCVAGPTFYDGTDLLTRINTTSSFGYLHQGHATLESNCVLSHNVAVRRSSYDRDVFGPFNGRTQGDFHMTDVYRARGEVRIEPGMAIHHENSTFNLRGLLDRHLREIFSVVPKLSKRSAADREGSPARVCVSELAALPFSVLFMGVMKAALKRPKRQFRRIRRFGRPLGVLPYHYPIVCGVLGLHALLDLSACLTILLVPGLAQRWLHYQFGQAA